LQTTVQSSTDNRRRLIIANAVPGDHNSNGTSGIKWRSRKME
jgi:hypothetical protein